MPPIGRFTACPQPWWGPSLAAAAMLLVTLSAPPPGRAGSVSADSIWDRSSALQRALQQVPAGATVTGRRCEEIGVRDSFRYRCWVEFSPAPPAPAAAP